MNAPTSPGDSVDLAGHRPIAHPGRRTAAHLSPAIVLRTVALLAVLVLALNVLAAWRYPGGPLEPYGAGSGPFLLRIGATPVVYSDDAAGWTPEAIVGPGEHVFLAGVWLRQDWPVGAVVERMEPVWKGQTPGVVRVLVRAADPRASGVVTITPSAHFVSAAAGGSFGVPPIAVAPSSCCEPDDQVLVEMDGSRLGVFHLAGFWMDYRVGPFAFRTFVPNGDAFRLSVPR